MQCVDGVRAAGVEPAARLGGGGGETSCMRRWRGLRARELGSWGAVVHMRGQGVRGAVRRLYRQVGRGKSRRGREGHLASVGCAGAGV